jgi:L-asparaginase II
MERRADLGDVLLAEVLRDERGRGAGVVESRHYGSIVIADVRGKVLATAGEDRELYLRSSSKPFQALAPVASGAADHYGFGSRELALFSASHSGQPVHVELARSILERLGLDLSNLECGKHAPIHQPSMVALYESGRRPNPLFNNCSGKHAGMLTLARFRHWDVAGYVTRSHPVQEEVFGILGALLDRDPADLPYGTDGCGVPTPLVRQSEQARLFALLANPDSAPDEFGPSLARIAEAMAAHPVLIAGAGRFNTDLVAALGDRLAAKTGAEGSIGVGLKGRGLGISIKVSDGNSRALTSVVTALLHGLGLLVDDAGRAFHTRFLTPAVTNARGERVGQVRACTSSIEEVL